MQPSAYMDRVRCSRPLVHHITNYVTVNDCANITISAGGSPVMADQESDAADIASVSSCLVINMGTVNERTFASMLAAGKAANDNGVPVVFDPVGAGASGYRDRVASSILSKVEVAVIKGNAGEMGVLSGVGGEVRGVDSGSASDPAASAAKLASEYGCVAAVTGQTDHVACGGRSAVLSNGHALLGCVSGTGCMVSSVVGAYTGACGASLESVSAAVTAFNVAAELSAERAGGPGTFKTGLFDALFNLDAGSIDGRSRIAMR